eukprot:TRINITY_DN191_c0_g1_i2.p6 TRINITY_DN191_c0_g1~~TRINITY_DN191_c0_g1_i2.p6  ORF type:complete len:224 (+),score=-3.62 TRINITY_DN191_c0_g1_i2:67-738(+)
MILHSSQLKQKLKQANQCQHATTQSTYKNNAAPSSQEERYPQTPTTGQTYPENNFYSEVMTPQIIKDGKFITQTLPASLSSLNNNRQPTPSSIAPSDSSSQCLQTATFSEPYTSNSSSISQPMLHDYSTQPYDQICGWSHTAPQIMGSPAVTEQRQNELYYQYYYYQLQLQPWEHQMAQYHSYVPNEYGFYFQGQLNRQNFCPTPQSGGSQIRYCVPTQFTPV